MLEPPILDRIRHIFLHPRPHVSISQASSLLGWSRVEMTNAIAAGEIELMTTALGKWVWREELMAKAVELWPREVIEEALGADADAVLPHAVRLALLRARIPRYQLAMLEYFAEQHRTTVSDVLTRELEGVASDHAEELAAVVPGFGAALAWPNAENADLSMLI
ncbi:MAG: hypothetical protein M3P06_07130 [Acidobacteriota bacterium]|nr:hypothetical protein [Acidobacteriota bacterium]